MSDTNEQKDPELLQKEETLKKDFNQIEDFFRRKQDIIQQYRHVPVEEVLRNAPKYYSFLRLFEQINSFLSKDSKWLEHYIDRKNIDFNWSNYNKWKNSREFVHTKYDDTYCPAKWVCDIQEKLIEILKQIQILLYMECYIDEENFRQFVMKNPEISFKMKANYMDKSIPSDNLSGLFSSIDYLIKTNVSNEMETKYIIDTHVCINAYRKIDDLKITDLLKRKEFYVKYRLQYLEMCPHSERKALPSEDDIIDVARMFCKSVDDFNFTFREYKQRLIDKHQNVKKKSR
jgi:hypothetical protein